MPQAPIPSPAAAPQSAAASAARLAVHVGLLIVLGLLLGGPLLIHGLPDLGHDAPQHMLWAKNFASQLWEGEPYPRWLADANAGLGSPAMFFYPPLPSYVAALFWPVAQDRDPHGALLAGYGCALGLIFSGVAAYFWLRSMVGPKAALCGAIVYLIAPYHLAVDLYNRAAAAEFWVFVWLPLVLWSAEGIARRRRWALLGLAVSYALSILSHPTVAFCLSVLPLAHVLVFSERGRGLAVAARTLAGLALGVGLAGALLVPALADQHKTHAALQAQGWADYRNHWLLNLHDPLAGRDGEQGGLASLVNFKVRVLATTLSTLAFVVAAFLAVRGASPPQQARRLARFYFVASCLAVFLMTQPSAFLWRIVPGLKLLQLPFRFNTVLVLAAAAVAGAACSCSAFKRPRVLAGVAGLLVLGWIAADGWAARSAYSAWRPIGRERATSLQRLLETQKEQFPWSWPRDTRVHEVFPLAAFESFIAAHPPRSLWLSGVASGQPAGMAIVQDWRPRRVTIRVNATEEGRLRINHFYYPGWQGRIEETGVAIPATPSAPDGLLELEVPRGDYVLVLELARELPERLGLGVSLASLLVAAALAAWMATRKQEALPPAAPAM